MLLLIPGPVTTDARVRAAAAQDYAPWDNDFRELYRQVCAGVLRAACAARRTCRAGLARLRSLRCRGRDPHADAAGRTPAGAVHRRLCQPPAAARRRGRPRGRRCCVGVRDRIDPQAVAQALEQDPTISHVALVCETSSGIATMRPPSPASRRRWGGASSSTRSRPSALPLDLSDLPAVDAVALTANKCLEGLPGAAFVVARRLDAAQGRAGSWSLDLADIYQQSLQPNAGPRFTRPRPRWPLRRRAGALS